MPGYKAATFASFWRKNALVIVVFQLVILAVCASFRSEPGDAVLVLMTVVLNVTFVCAIHLLSGWEILRYEEDERLIAKHQTRHIGGWNTFWMASSVLALFCVVLATMIIVTRGDYVLGIVLDIIAVGSAITAYKGYMLCRVLDRIQPLATD
jgi:hypothetical protein